MLERWARLFDVRELVLRRLEEARVQKKIGSSLEARVVLIAKGKHYEFLKHFEEQLRYVFIVSQVTVTQVHSAMGAIESPSGVSVLVERAAGEKCERCWNYSKRVGEFTRYTTVCERCVEALAEIESEGGVE